MFRQASSPARADPRGASVGVGRACGPAARAAFGGAAGRPADAVRPLTQQAADLIQVSRPYLIKLLEEGRIAYRKVGTHRRIRIADVLKYKEVRDERRRADLKELIRVSESMGLYDDETSPGESD